MSVLDRLYIVSVFVHTVRSIINKFDYICSQAHMPSITYIANHICSQSLTPLHAYSQLYMPSITRFFHHSLLV